MQVNVFDVRIREVMKYLGWVLFFLLLWFKGCSHSEETVKTVIVKSPEIKATFEPKKPVQEPLQLADKTTEKTIIKWKDKEIKVENPVNTELAQKYVMANDSIERLNMYIKAIGLNKFSSVFEDDNLLLNINGVVQGEVQEITPSYTIKSRELPIEVKQKESKFRLLLGASLGINKDLNQGAYNINLDFQNRKGDVFSVEYLRADNQSFGMVGFKKSLINIRR